jgi:hypothetical protein
MDPHRSRPDAPGTQPPMLGSGELEPVYPPDMAAPPGPSAPFDQSAQSAQSAGAPVVPAPPGPADAAQHTRTRTWVWVAALVLAAATVVAVLLFGTDRSSPGRGAGSAEAAAEQFVAALNAGDKRAAAEISCTGFQDQARSEAVSGMDPAISFHLDGVDHLGDGAQARISQTFELPDGTPPQVQPIVLDVIRTDGNWLVCGTA